MGISSLINRTVNNGDGTTQSFSFPYEFFEISDLQVWVYDTILGGTVLQTLGVQYTFSGTANAQGIYPNGGSVVFGTAPLSTSIVIIVRAPPQEQEFALQQNGLIPSVSLVNQLDYLTLLVQRLQDQINKCIMLPDGVGPTFSNKLPSTAVLNPDYYVVVNNAGNGWSLVPGLTPMQEVVVGYAALSAASTNFQLELFTIPAGSILTYVVIKHTTSFTGGGISDVKASIGTAGAPTLFVNSFDVYQAPGDTVYQSVVANFIGSFVNTTGIYLTAVSSGANLSALGAGSLNVWYDYDSL